MSSSLRDQLRKRRVSKPVEREVHFRPSLLFDKNEAARIDITTIHKLALEGLEQLQPLDPRIRGFKSTLFSESAKEMSREQETKEVNAKIDESINSFLSLISPFFLLKGAHKVIEYLIRRYKIQRYNVNALFKCVLPYHETNTFVRLIQTVENIQNTQWAFFGELRNTGIAPQRSFLCKQLQISHVLREFICEMVKSAVESHTSYAALHSFYASLFSEAIAQLSSIPDDFVKDIYGYILIGIRSEDEEYQSSTFMIVMSLVSHSTSTLVPEAVKEILDAIVQHALPHRRYHAVLTILALFQTHKSLLMSKKIFKIFSQWKEIPEIFLRLEGSKFDLKKFFSAYLQMLAGKRSSKYINSIISIVAQVPNLSEIIPDVVKTVIQTFCKNFSSAKESKRNNQVKTLISVLDTKYRNELDQGIDEILKMENTQKMEILNSEGWSFLFSGTRFQVITQSEEEIVTPGNILTVRECLNPKSPVTFTIRALELLSQVKPWMETEENSSEAQTSSSELLLKNAVLSLLNLESHPDVINYILSMNILRESSIFRSDEIIKKVISLLNATGSSPKNSRSEKIQNSLVDFLRDYLSAQPNLTETILPVLILHILVPQISKNVTRKDSKNVLPTKAKISNPEVTVTWHLTNSCLTILKSIHHSLLGGVDSIEHVKSEDEHSNMVKNLIEIIGKNFSENFELLNGMISRIVKNSPENVACFFILVQNHALHVLSDQNHILTLQSQLLSHTSTFMVSHMTGPNPQFHTIPTMAENLSPISSLLGLPKWNSSAYSQLLSDKAHRTSQLTLRLHTISNILLTIKNRRSLLKNQPQTEVLRTIFSLVTAHPHMLGLCNKHSILEELFMIIGNSVPEFLVYFCTTYPKKVSDLTQVHSLKILTAYMQAQSRGPVSTKSKSAESRELPLSFSEKYASLILIAGLVCLQSPLISVRSATLDLLRKFNALLKLVNNESRDKLISSFNKKNKDKISLNILHQFVDGIIRFTESEGSVNLPRLSLFYQEIFSPTSGTVAHAQNLRSNSVEIQNFLLESILSIDLSKTAQHALLNSLQEIQNADKLAVIFPYLVKILEQVKASNGSSQKKSIYKDYVEYWNSKVAKVLLENFSETNVSVISSSEEYFQFIVTTISDPFHIDFQEEENLTHEIFSPQGILIEQITPVYFSVLTTRQKKEIFGIFSKLMISANNFVKELVRQSVKQLEVPPQIVEQEMVECLHEVVKSPSEGDQAPKPIKRARVESKSDTTTSKEIPSKLTVMLEMLQYTPKIISHRYIQPLFQLLGILSDPSNSVSRDSASEYTQQLVLTTLITITKAILEGRNQKEIPRDRDNDVEMQEISQENYSGPILDLDGNQISDLSNIYDIPGIIHCIRSSENPTIHNTCLLLLSHVAELLPKQVLDNTIAIFTFMGISARRSDDSYTFFVFQRAINGLIPAILKSGMGLSSLLSALVSEFDYVPAHRRLLLFTIVGETIGFYHLSELLLMFIVQHIKSRSSDLMSEPADSKNISGETEFKYLDFVQSLCLKFPPYHVIQGLLSIFSCVSHIFTGNQLEENKGSVNIPALKEIIGDWVQDSKKKSKLYKNWGEEITRNFYGGIFQNIVLTLFHTFFSSEAFHEQILKIDSADSLKSYQVLYTHMFREVLHQDLISKKFLQEINSGKTHSLNKQSVDRITSVVSQTSNLSLDVISSLNDLLSTPKFLEVISYLITNKNLAVQRQALLLANSRLESQPPRNPSESEKYVKLSDKVVEILVSTDKIGDEEDILEDDEQFISSLTKQTAALTLELLAKKFAGNSTYAQIFVEHVPQLLIPLARNSGDSLAVKASVMVSLATLSAQLGANLLPYVNSLFPTVLDLLDDYLSSSTVPSESENLIQLSSLSSLEVLISHLGKFLTKYLDRVLIIILNPKFVLSSTQNVTVKHIQDKVAEILNLMANSLPIQYLLTPITNAYNHFIKLIKNARQSETENQMDEKDQGSLWERSLTQLFNFVEKIAGVLVPNSEPVKLHHKAFFKFFLLVFDFSTDCKCYRTDPEDIVKQDIWFKNVENSIMSSFTRFALKLNEKLFKPLFLVLVERVRTSETTTSDKVPAKENTSLLNAARWTFFYGLLTHLTNSLRDIFVPYFAYVFPHIVQLLKLPPPKEFQDGDSSEDDETPKSSNERLATIFCALQVSIVEALTSCFTYDNSGFLSVEKFESILHPLVNSLDHVGICDSGISSGLLGDRVAKYYVPCFTSLAANANNEALWKPLNYQLLLKTNSEDPKVRYTVVMIISGLYAKLGEQFLTFLPESMQYISELSEDPDPNVEAVTNKLLNDLGKLTGDENSIRDLLS